MTRTAGDVDYVRFGTGYTDRRRSEPRIAALIHQALGPAQTVLNIGAGPGSYEPSARRVVAVEPSEAMIAQRPSHLSPPIRAVADTLPFRAGAVDASMAVVTVHQWPDPGAGLAEMRRVTTGPVVVLTFDPDALRLLWLSEYVPELYSVEANRYPSISSLAAAMGPATTVQPVPVPFGGVDGFTEAFYGRPEAFLDPAVRGAQSAWSFLEPEVEARFVEELADDLTSGRWDRRHGSLRTRPEFSGAIRLVVGR